MKMKEAMESYFKKLEAMYKKMFGTLPTVSWAPELPANLFVGTPDEDDEIAWKYQAAGPVRPGALCEELGEFFGSFYYWELRGKYQKITFDFPAIPTTEEAERVAEAAVADGEYYFPKKETVLLATCSYQGNDDLLLFYRQRTGELFLYDTDKRFVHPLGFHLTELIGSMEAVL